MTQSQSFDVELDCKPISYHPLEYECRYDSRVQLLSAGENLNMLCDGTWRCNKDTGFDLVTHMRFYKDSSMNRFPREIFRQLPSLRELKLTNMEIPDLTKDDLNEATNLTHLELGGNKIRHLSSNVILMAPQLKWLDLVNNKIESIDNHAFNSSTLQVLFLNKNKLTSLKGRTFSGATNLLDENSIENIEDGTFNLPKLEIVVLNENRLKTLPENLFANAPNLNELRLHDNQLGEILNVDIESPFLAQHSNDDGANFNAVATFTRSEKFIFGQL